MNARSKGPSPAVVVLEDPTVSRDDSILAANAAEDFQDPGPGSVFWVVGPGGQVCSRRPLLSGRADGTRGRRPICAANGFAETDSARFSGVSEFFLLCR